jgi:hypothetical protein
MVEELMLVFGGENRLSGDRSTTWPGRQIA